MLKNSSMKTPKVIISFDESFDSVSKTFQIVLNVAYWNLEIEKVKVWYWDSKTSRTHCLQSSFIRT